MLPTPRWLPAVAAGLFLVFALRARAQAPYRVVVADARTRAALPAATVRADGRPLRTDDAGRLALPAPPATLHISHLGYQPRHWQPAPAADTLWLQPQAVALPDVRVRAQPRVLVWRAPGHARWPQDAFAQSLEPTEQLAMRYQSPDPTRRYRIVAVRLRLGSRLPENPAGMLLDQRRFIEGRLRVQLLAPGPDGAPATELLPVGWEITPAQSAAHQGGWLRLPVADTAPLLLPAAGVFIVAAGLPGRDETLVRRRRLVYQKHSPTTAPDYDPKQTKSTRISRYVELQPAGGGAVRLAPHADYPAVASLTAPSEAACYAWQYRGRSWQKLVDFQRKMSQSVPGQRFTPYNYELELEVEEL